jgi:glutathione S-transferase
MGRFAPDEIAALGSRSIRALAEFLGDKPFFMGTEPSGVDASVFALVAGVLCPQFRSPVRDAAERYDNLRRYVGRMTARYYPDYKEIAGCPAAA